MNICLFTPQEITEPLKLTDERAEHLLKILHKKTGDTFTAGIIGGQSGVATITKFSEKTDSNDGTLTFSFKPEGDGKPLKNLKMIIGFPRPIQLKRLLRDIAALGVCEVHLTGTELGEKSYMQSNLVEHGAAYKMLLDGTVQAGSTHVPELFLHKTLKECIAAVVLSDNANQMKLALDNVNPKKSLYAQTADLRSTENNAPAKTFEVVAAIGSERGWTDRERQMLETAGFIRCGMGERIMRTETAATVAGAIILANMGELEKL